MMISLIYYFCFSVFYVHAQLSDFDVWPFPSNVVVNDVAASPFDDYIYVVGSIDSNNQFSSFNQGNGTFIWEKNLGNDTMVANSVSIDSVTGDIYIGGIGVHDLYAGATYVIPFVGRFSNTGDLVFKNYFGTYSDTITPTLKKLRTKRIGSTVYAVASGSDRYYPFLTVYDQSGTRINENIKTNNYGSTDNLALGDGLEIYQSYTRQYNTLTVIVRAYLSTLSLHYQIQSLHDAQALYYLNGTLYVAGQTRASSNGTALTTNQYDVIVSKYDTSGNLLQSMIFGGDDQDTPADMLVHPTTMEIFICGTTLSKVITNSPSHGSKDVFVAKLDSNLNLLWVKLFGWKLDDLAATISLHPNNRIYMAAQMNSTGGNSVYGVISIDATIPGQELIMTSISSSTILASTIQISPSTILASTIQSHSSEYKSDLTVFNNFIMTFSFNGTVSSSPVSKKTSETFQGSSLDSPSYFWPTMIGLCIAFFLILILIVSRIYFNQRKEKLLDMTKQSTEITTTTTTGTGTEYEKSSSYSSTVPTTSTTFTESLATQIVTQNAYSIPGYLQLNKEDISVIKEIASGGQGTISLAEVLNSQFFQQYKVKQVIVKSTGLHFDQMNERQQNSFNQELAIIHYFNDKNGFVKLFGYTLEPTCLILKFYPLGNMENMIKKKGRFSKLITSKHFIIFFLWEFAKSVLLLHDAGFVHCDIKPQNILLDADQKGTLHPILTDFGITQVVSEKVLKVRAMAIENLKGFSLYYAAPEQIQQLRENLFKSLSAEVIKRRDIYAIAGLMYGLMMKLEPWHS